MNPGAGLITLVNAQLQRDPAFVRQIRDMHAAGVPLLDMVDQLGLGGAMSDQVRAIVQRLTPGDVDAIRQATLDMLDRAENQMPVDCNLSQQEIDSETPVTVAVGPDTTGNQTITVRSARAS